MIKCMKTLVITISVYLLGAILVGLPGAPMLGLSLVDTAHAARPAVHRSAHRTARPARRHTHVDVDVDGHGRVRDVDVDVDRHGRYRSVDVDVDRGPRVAAAVAVGTRVATLPSECTTVVTDDVTYHHCGGVYYRPYYEGTRVVYMVVDAP